MRRIFILTLACLSLMACDFFDTSTAAPPTKTKHQHAILSFGTVIDITLIDVDETTARKVFTMLDDDFAYWHNVWSPWKKGPLARVNTLIPTKAAFNLPLHIIPLISQSQRLFEQSEGLFNPAIGQLINLWQFHKYKEEGKQPPAADEINRVVAANPNMKDLELTNIQLQSRNEHISLNFGAFAKGFAIERSMETLRQFGIRHAVINAGGDLKVIGQHTNRPWRIGIRHPRDKNSVIASIEATNNESVFTSGDYERFFIFNQRRYNHILDPRTGYPADASQSVTVIHEDAGIADAAATAIFVAGPDHWHRIAKKMGIKFVMLVAANGDIHLNPAMARRVKLNNTNNASVKLSEAL